MRLTIFGLGEAGGRYATDLAAAGHTVRGFDPGVASAPPGVLLATELEVALSDPELILVLTPSSLSATLVSQSLPHLTHPVVWADFTSGSPQLMAEIGARFVGTSALFADVAVLGPVPLKGAQTDLLTSGPGATVVKTVFEKLGAFVELLETGPGDATARKLLRSVFMKSIATVVIEALDAGRASGCESWVRGQIEAQLTNGDVMVDRFVVGSRLHAKRRAHEMKDAVAYLDTLGVARDMSAASWATLTRLDFANETALTEA